MRSAGVSTSASTGGTGASVGASGTVGTNGPDDVTTAADTTAAAPTSLAFTGLNIQRDAEVGAALVAGGWAMQHWASRTPKPAVAGPPARTRRRVRAAVTEPCRCTRAPPSRGLSSRFAVRCDDERLGDRVDAVLAGLRDPAAATAPVDHWYSLTATPGGAGTVDVTRDGEPLAHDQCPGDALGWVVWDVNRVRRRGERRAPALPRRGARRRRDRRPAARHVGVGQVDLDGGPGPRRPGLPDRRAGRPRPDERAAAALPQADHLEGRELRGACPTWTRTRAGGPGAASWAGEEWQVAVGGGHRAPRGQACAPASGRRAALRRPACRPA